MHKDIEPAILYFGTPVVLISTINPDGTANLAPMSSIWWLGWSCMVGLDASSQTVENIRRTGECVLNLASAELVKHVDRLAKTTGRTKVPLHKKSLGYAYESNKFQKALLTEQASTVVNAPRVMECSVQLEAKLCKETPFGADNSRMAVPAVAFELDIVKVHVEESLLAEHSSSHVDPDKWHPLIMSFRKFYSTGDYVHKSRLAEGGESQYAPWKKKGLRRKLTEWAIRRSTNKYKQPIADETPR